jgi:hydroxymethylpyrimidine/phosphomethylpyrimidine kinase
MDRGDRAVAVKKDPHVLVIAGSDSSGGAGIARDIETIAAFGLRTCVTVTAVTVQTNEAVRGIEFMPPDLVAAQMHAAFDSNHVTAIKIGMLGTNATAEAVASVLCKHPSVPAVLDPVLVASSGFALTDASAVEALKRALLSLCSIITPNLPEMAMLAGTQMAEDEADLLRQGRLLLNEGAPAVLVKGGHASGYHSTDLLLSPGRTPVRFKAPRLNARMRGTGCMLASAIAANLALGVSLEESARKAKWHVLQRLRSG